MQPKHESMSRLLVALHSSKPVVGFTHGFYRYPATMLPELAREVIQQFTRPGDIIFDPFMGGGTSIIEAIAAGRRALGIDINSLAVFITETKTTPLSTRDEHTINQWVLNQDFAQNASGLPITEPAGGVRNFPEPARQLFGRLMEELRSLPYRRQRQFARCCLLRLGQWAIEGRSTFPDPEVLKEKLLTYLQEMHDSLQELVAAAKSYGIAKNKLKKERLLLFRSICGADTDDRLHPLIGKPKLVITSPPYPGVHVLYHRWQVKGRRETPAPYWFIGANDGHGASYYTLGSRTPFGLDNYFRGITEAFRSVRHIVHREALVVQLVSFSEVASQLPAFLEAMRLAGYEEVFPFGLGRANLWRTVPNRKWYNRIDAARGTGQELLLFHRPCS